MKTLLMGFAAILVSSSAFALTDAEQAEKNSQQYIRYAQDHQAQLAKYNSEMKDLMTELAKQAAVIKQAEQRVQNNGTMVAQKKDTWYGGTTFETTYQPKPEDVQALQVAKNKYAQIRANLGLDDSAAKTQAYLANKSKEQAAEESGNAAQARRDFRDSLAAVSLSTEYAKLNNNLIGTRDMIDEIEKKYDKSILAAYLRDKMQGFLNSDALCAMVKDTAKTGQCKQTDANALKSLFPTTASRQRGGSTYSTPAPKASSR